MCIRDRDLFAAVKHIFDPDNLLNPGVLVDPRPLDADLRLPAVAGSTLPRLDAGFSAEVHRCTGVAKCLADSGGVMCPSYQATGREQDSTRAVSYTHLDVYKRQGGRSPTNTPSTVRANESSSVKLTPSR